MWCEGDANGDFIVNVEDLIDLLAAWGETDCRPEDLNESGEVNTADLLILLGDWGCPEYVNDPPQSVQDCLDEYGSDPEALLACLEAISLSGGE
jgi:hypothetical protein